MLLAPAGYCIAACTGLSSPHSFEYQHYLQEPVGLKGRLSSELLRRPKRALSGAVHRRGVRIRTPETGYWTWILPGFDTYEAHGWGLTGQGWSIELRTSQGP